MTEPELIPVFMPSLVSILLGSEQRKGSPLSEQEVVDIRDKGACIMVPAENVGAIVEKRGYDDIDPENVWAEWQRARIEIAEA